MTAGEFLFSHKQSADNVDVERSLERFWTQMRLGLEGRDGGLPMIPTYLRDIDRSAIKTGSKRILIDAGGTNFRCALGYFDDEGKVHIEQLSKSKMPASDTELSKEEFYGAIASRIAPLLPQAQNIGFCFSYQVDMGQDVDGRVVMFSKEVKAPQVVGTKVGEQTLEACRKYDATPRKIVILNDTVATLLGGMATSNEQFSAYLGYIYGTGTNVCYIEDTENIAKVKGLPSGKMLVNTECGNFAGFEQGDFDRTTVARTALPDKQLFEKMTSGKYLADLMYEALRVARDEGLFEGETRLQPFELKYVSDFMEGDNSLCSFQNAKDIATARQICDLLILRSAKMGAIVNSALAIVSCKDKSKPVAIVAEGTTFNKLRNYRKYFESYLSEILGKRGIGYKIVQGEELNLVGTLMATMVLK